ncbi:unnamed protein product [Owenia fusiformis]|uniref:Uncharacterized protein n=1 Tax=Owenia fusiformis TaxID=6347 RepID=A0A8J1U559_OWEFU|nr:unnamed protein product [Owenia fusiformis]
MAGNDVFSKEVEEHLTEIIQKTHPKVDPSVCYREFIETITTPPAYTVVRVNTMKQSREDTMKQLQRELDKQCRERERELSIVEPHLVLPDALVVKHRKPNHEIPKHPLEVIVDVFCGMSVMRGADIYCQGIMGAPPIMKPGDLVSVFVDLDGKCLKGLPKSFDGARYFLGNGKAIVSRQDLFCFEDEAPDGVGIKMMDTIYEAPSLNNLLPQLIFAQNLPSIVCSHVLDPKPGEYILDMCASPGGKTTHLGTLMNNTGKVIAFDKGPSKIAKIESNVKMWDLTIIEPYAFNACNAFDPTAPPSGPPPYPEATFDKVLLDGPCSALGQRPLLKNKSSLKQIKSNPPLQKRIFDNAVKLLKPGGTLVYSTCTITLEENEGIVCWALDKYPCLSLEDQFPHIGGSGRKGTNLNDTQLAKLQVFDMFSKDEGSYDNDTIGFFIAKFKKIV